MEFSRLRVERGNGSGSHMVVRLAGELDMADAEALRGLLADATSRADLVVVDLADLSFIDSSGFRALHEAHRDADACGSRLLFASPAPAVARMVELMRFDHLQFTDDRSALDGATADGSGPA